MANCPAALDLREDLDVCSYRLVSSPFSVLPHCSPPSCLLGTCSSKAFPGFCFVSHLLQTLFSTVQTPPFTERLPDLNHLFVVDLALKYIYLLLCEED